MYVWREFRSHHFPSVVIPQWREMCTRWEGLRDTVTIVIVGKYTGMNDAYLSVIKALQHAALMCDRKVIIEVCAGHVLRYL